MYFEGRPPQVAERWMWCVHGRAQGVHCRSHDAHSWTMCVDAGLRVLTAGPCLDDRHWVAHCWAGCINGITLHILAMIKNIY